MKGEIKRKYQDFINHVDFPMLVYVYEDNKIIAINDCAKGIIGENITDIRILFEGKKLKYSKEVLDNGCEFFINSKIYLNCSVTYFDMDISVISVDNIHIVFVIFESSFKNLFLGNLSIQTPRLIYKFADNDNIGLCACMKQDISNSNISTNSSITISKDVLEIIEKMEKDVYQKKTNQYNIIEMLHKKEKSDVFIKINTMPIIDNSGTIIGAIGIYNQILSKEKQKQIYASAIKNSSIVSKIMDKGDTVFIGWLNDENTSIQYVSPNISIYGYDAQDLCDGKISFKDIISEEDYETLKEKFSPKAALNDEEKKTYEYRIKQTNGEYVWVHEECIPVVIRKNAIYNFSSIRKISKKRMEIEEDYYEKRKCFCIDGICENMKSVFDMIESNILVLDVDNMKIKYFNKKVKDDYNVCNDIDINEFFNKNNIRVEKNESYLSVKEVLNIALERKDEIYSENELIEKKALIYDMNNKQFLLLKAMVIESVEEKKEVVIIIDKM